MNTNEGRPTANWAAAGVEDAGANSEFHYTTVTQPNASHSSRTPIYADNGRIVGVVVGEVFKRTAQRSKHLLRQYPGPGWAQGVEVLADAEEAGARWVEIDETEHHVTYTASLETLRAHGVDFERNAGPQVCLPLKWWTTSTDTAPQFTPPTVTEATPKKQRGKFTPPPLSGVEFTGAQLDLFAESARAADSVLENAALLPNGKRRAAMRRKAQRLTRKLAGEICEVASAGGGQ